MAWITGEICLSTACADPERPYLEESRLTSHNLIQTHRSPHTFAKLELTISGRLYNCDNERERGGIDEHTELRKYEYDSIAGQSL